MGWKIRESNKWTTQWYLAEDPNLTINVNLETLDDWVDEGKPEKAYLVYPAYKDRGIPNSPDVYIESEYLDLEDARKAAIREAAKILRLRVDSVRVFDWGMID